MDDISPVAACLLVLGGFLIVLYLGRVADGDDEAE